MLRDSWRRSARQTRRRAAAFSAVTWATLTGETVRRAFSCVPNSPTRVAITDVQSRLFPTTIQNRASDTAGSHASSPEESSKARLMHLSDDGQEAGEVDGPGQRGEARRRATQGGRGVWSGSEVNAADVVESSIGPRSTASEISHDGAGARALSCQEDLLATALS